MAPKKKPAFLKTFSEFTIDELRSMPFTRVLSLFSSEVQATFTKPTDLPKQKSKRGRSKKAEAHRAKKKTISHSELGKALKRILTPGPVAYPTDVKTQTLAIENIEVQTPKVSRKKTKKIPAVKKNSSELHEETVVFNRAPEEQIPLTHTP